MQYAVSLFASLSYFLMTRLMFFNTFYVSFFIFLFFLCYVFCVFVSFCVSFHLSYIPVYFLFLDRFTDRCHHVDTRLQKINNVSYQCIGFQTPRTDIVNQCRNDKATTKSEFSQNSKGCGVPHKIVG